MLLRDSRSRYIRGSVTRLIPAKEEQYRFVMECSIMTVAILDTLNFCVLSGALPAQSTGW